MDARGQPERVNVHDFLDRELGKATPYGVYDVTDNTGWVTVGTDHDTTAFAVATIRRWWHTVRQAAYPDATRLLITADGGGSNGYRIRAWKTELAALAARHRAAPSPSATCRPGTSSRVGGWRGCFAGR